ncbi:MAG: hypothetical protein JXR07_19020 [Reichenbachiella sp.]
MALLIGSAFFACVNDIGGILLTDHANRLISSDSTKFWKRVTQTIDGTETDLNDCANHQVLLFANYATVADTVLRIDQAYDCDGANLGLVSKNVYEVNGNIDDHFEYSLSTYPHIDSTITSVIVHDITSQYLRIGFEEEGKEVIETYNFDEELHNSLYAILSTSE